MSDLLSAEDLADILNPKYKRYVATGDTYPHRKWFVEWAWHWNAGRRAWIEDNHSSEDWPGVALARKLPGVVITEEIDDD